MHSIYFSAQVEIETTHVISKFTQSSLSDPTQTRVKSYDVTAAVLFPVTVCLCLQLSLLCQYLTARHCIVGPKLKSIKRLIT